MRDNTGVPVGLPVHTPLDALAFDGYATSGDVPNGAVEADVRFVLPPGAVVELEALSLRVVGSTEVTLYVASEAPGELTFTDVTVNLDEAPPTPPPVPPAVYVHPLQLATALTTRRVTARHVDPTARCTRVVPRGPTQGVP